MESTTVQLSSSDNLFKLVTNEDDPNRPILTVQMTDAGGDPLGGFIRVWFQDGRLVSDLPGVDGAYFHQQGANNHIEVNGLVEA